MLVDLGPAYVVITRLLVRYVAGYEHLARHALLAHLLGGILTTITVVIAADVVTVVGGWLLITDCYILLTGY